MCFSMEDLAGFLGVNGGFSLASDLCAQAVERRLGGKEAAEGIDWGRASAFTASGIAFSGMTQFVRHYCVDEMFPKGAGLGIAAGKTVVNQIIFAPVLRAASMGAVQYMQTQSWGDVKEKIAADFFEAQGISYLVKPASNFVAFAVFPNNLVGQAVVLRLVGFGYNVYYSYLVNRSLPSHRSQPLEERVCDYGTAVSSEASSAETAVSTPTLARRRTHALKKKSSRKKRGRRRYAEHSEENEGEEEEEEREEATPLVDLRHFIQSSPKRSPAPFRSVPQTQPRRLCPMLWWGS